MTSLSRTTSLAAGLLRSVGSLFGVSGILLTRDEIKPSIEVAAKLAAELDVTIDI